MASLLTDDDSRSLLGPPSLPDLGPQNWQYGPLEPAMQNALLALGYDRHRDSIQQMVQQWLAPGIAPQLQATPLDEFIRAGRVQSPPPPQMPTHYAPPPQPAIGSDPRFANLRPSTMIQDERPTGLLLRAQR